MALLRNLRNIIEARVSAEHIEKVCTRLADPYQVAKSKQFPFRFMSAYREVEMILTHSATVVKPPKVKKIQKIVQNAVQNTVAGSNFGSLFGTLNIEPPKTVEPIVEEPAIEEPIVEEPVVMEVVEPIVLTLPEVSEPIPKVLAALEKAIQASVVNMRAFGNTDKIVIACDVSGSMCMPISQKSTVQMFDIGLVLGMLLQSKCENVLMGMFGDTWKSIDLPSTGILSNVQLMRNRAGEVGYSTNGYLVISDLIARKYVADKVMMFTDMQMWNSTGGTQHVENLWIEYREKIAPNAKLYLFDLAGHGNTPLDLSKNNGVALIAGWSDKVFDVLQSIENGESALNLMTKIEL
jgi:TROVE domain